MASYNRVLLIGNLTRNVEIRYTPSGTAVADLGMAINEDYKNKAGEKVESTVFVDVVVWGRQAETSAEYLQKGSAVFVEGRLQLDQWENQQGEKRSKLRVRADRIQFLDSKERKGGTTPDSVTDRDRRPPDSNPTADEYDDDIPF